jgi:hypothetical protein
MIFPFILGDAPGGTETTTLSSDDELATINHAAVQIVGGREGDRTPGEVDRRRSPQAG